MGCGSSTAQKVSPSTHKKPANTKPKIKEETPVEVIAKADSASNKTKSVENVRPSTNDSKLLTKRPSSHNGSIASGKGSPKAGLKSRKLIRDSRGSVRPGSSSSTNSEIERNFSGDTRNRASVEKLFQASSPSTQEIAASPPIGITFFFFFFLVAYVEERLWWPIQSPNIGGKKKASS